MVAEKVDTTFKQQESDIIKERKHYSQRFWMYINSLQPKETTSKTTALHTTSGLVLTTREEMETYLTSHFTTLQDNPQKHVPQDTNTAIDKMNRRKQEHSILNPISTTELKRRISDLKNQKATGPDDIPNEFLKALKTKARETLRHCFNNILESGQIPPAWKEAKVTLIHKGK